MTTQEVDALGEVKEPAVKFKNTTSEARKVTITVPARMSRRRSTTRASATRGSSTTRKST